MQQNQGRGRWRRELTGMRILVYPHVMEIGGSQLNAVQLAGAVRDRGHEVIVLSGPGPVVERVHGMGLEHLEIPLHRRRPSLGVISKLVRLVRERHLDVVHGYEWPPVIEAFFGPGLRYRTPVVGTVMSMSIVPFLPHTVPLMVGTERIRETAIAAGHRRVTLLEPPVDTEADNPSVDGRPFRAEHGIRPGEVLMAMICRLVPDLKLEGLLSACDAVGELASAGRPVRLMIVGDGSARAEVAERAAKTNMAAGRRVVLLTGEIADPRPAYAAADVVIGQGGSALRGMAFGKPLVVVGEDGFSELLTPQSAPIFLRQGWYGLGAGSLGTGAPALRLALEPLVGSLELQRELGASARRLVEDRFSLHRAAHLQEEEYLAAVRDRIASGPRFVDLVKSAAGLLSSKLQRRYHWWRGTAEIDDSNARAVVSRVLAGGRTKAQPGAQGSTTTHSS
jgi:glycosyltransferase involved in cell wall biosynthesis